MTTPLTVPLGSQVRLTGTFTNLLTGLPADPTTVTLYVEQPGAATVTPYTTLNGVVKDSVGVYHYDLLLNLSGTWWWAWVGVGAIVAAQPDTEIIVGNSRLH